MLRVSNIQYNIFFFVPYVDVKSVSYSEYIIVFMMHFIERGKD